MAMTVVFPLPVAIFMAQEFGIRLCVGALYVLPDGAILAFVRPGNLGEPDQGLDSLDLAEERAHSVELVLAPMAKELLGRGRHAPIRGVRQSAPGRYVLPDLVDDGSWIVLLLFAGKAVTDAQRHCNLVVAAATPPRSRPRNRSNERRGAAPLDRRLLQRLAVLVKRMVSSGYRVG
jgi:hypothetical protein